MPEYLFRDSPARVEITGTQGHYSIGKKGQKWLDFRTGWGIGNAGWNNAFIEKAIRNFKGPTYVTPTQAYQRWEDLAEKLVGLMPSSNYTCFRATGGTEAVEIALKTAKAFNHRSKFVAFQDAYHGQSLTELALVGLHEKQLGPYGNQYVRLAANDWQKTTRMAVEAILQNDVCAFIAEPILVNLGIMVPPASFFVEVQKACNETDTVFILDEVITGFGRTGKMFGFEHYGLKPDIITIAKGFSSGHAPIGATIVSSKVAEAMRFDFSNYSSFGWHPRSTEAAIANIDFIAQEKLVEKSKKSGEILSNSLSSFCHPEGKGLCIGFDFRNPNIKNDCLKDGLLIGQTEKRALLLPPLDVTRTEIKWAVEILHQNSAKD